ncbi:MAG: LytTR family transcriptional regulator DNA-binding domain-containing protein, partial [Clostridia bacterium]|nr:LytTR family transcriptional regulator DNA-binding domain-containing protein [Clostridia bacterium]
SYIANLQHISRITKTDVVFDNGKSIPVSRRMYNDVNMAFINFYRGKIK